MCSQNLVFPQEERNTQDQEHSTPHHKKKVKRSKSNRLKNHIKASIGIKRVFGGGEGGKDDRTLSPSLSFDSGSGDEEGPQLGIGVKTHSQKISETVSVNYPIQCQVRETC